jgi:hypothetical protein
VIFTYLGHFPNFREKSPAFKMIPTTRGNTTNTMLYLQKCSFLHSLKIMHFYHLEIVFIYVCILLKYSYVSLTWSSLGMSSYNKSFVGLQTHMENIWHPNLCNPKQWTFAPLSQLAHYWHIRSMISLCTTSPLVIKQYTHDTLPLFA